MPRRCVICRAHHSAGLCERCYEKLPWLSEPCVRGVCSVLAYEDNVREALHRFKFNGLMSYSEVFGYLMAGTALACGLSAEAVTWVPSSPLRIRRRGYDQCRQLARVVAAHMGLEMCHTLEKTRNSPSQTKMTGNEERTLNVSGAFKANKNASGKTLLLCDDIVTSGATLFEARETLMAAGARSVTCLTLARAPGFCGENAGKTFTRVKKYTANYIEKDSSR